MGSDGLNPRLAIYQMGALMRMSTKSLPNAETPLGVIAGSLASRPDVLEVLILCDLSDGVVDGVVLGDGDVRPLQEELPDVFDYVVLTVKRVRPVEFAPGITRVK